jgi:RNase adaptor protein for sRNA GlmZ degradation
VLVTGISGSGKSVALHALEDAGFYCVDNLPPELLRDFLRLERQRVDRRAAIAVDVRSAASLPHLLPLLAQLRNEGVAVHPIFLDATTAALVRRFSETRRAHPLADRGALVEAIELERELLAGLRELSTVLDTSQLRPTQLRSWMRELVRAPESRLTLVFESFAYRHGVPLDADYVFDVRVLPNPHYVAELRPLTGLQGQHGGETAEHVGDLGGRLRIRGFRGRGHAVRCQPAVAWRLQAEALASRPPPPLLRRYRCEGNREFCRAHTIRRPLARISEFAPLSCTAAVQHRLGSRCT